jgi:trimethylamine:corrinoid methyltransferase-like protein
MAREDEANETEKEATVNTQNMKDDIARLLHLFKEPVAQVHWSNLYGVLNCAELDARRTDGPLSDAANALSCLVEIFNDYESFYPQNLMVEYVNAGRNQRPIKRTNSICSQLRRMGSTC